jgi:hypothetical protein
MGNKTHINSAKLFVGKGVTLMVSWDDFLHLNQKFFVAFIAAVIAIWVMIVNVEIDSTIQTLILTLSHPSLWLIGGPRQAEQSQ